MDNLSSLTSIFHLTFPYKIPSQKYRLLPLCLIISFWYININPLWLNSFHAFKFLHHPPAFIHSICPIPLIPILMTVQSNLQRFILESDVSSRNANAEASLVSKLSHTTNDFFSVRVSPWLQTILNVFFKISLIVELQRGLFLWRSTRIGLYLWLRRLDVFLTVNVIIVIAITTVVNIRWYQYILLLLYNRLLCLLLMCLWIVWFHNLVRISWWWSWWWT